MNYKNISGEASMKFVDLRKKVGTQIDIASLLNIDQSSIAKYEKGKAYPRRNTLKKLSELFGVSEGDILTAIDNSKR